MLCRICVLIIQIQPRKHALDHADYIAPTRQRELEDRTNLFPDRSGSWELEKNGLFEVRSLVLGAGPRSNVPTGVYCPNFVPIRAHPAGRQCLCMGSGGHAHGEK